MNRGKKELPDFKQLDDRVFRDPPSEPMLVIKTNLDPKNANEENPYYQENSQDQEEFEEFFED